VLFGYHSNQGEHQDVEIVTGNESEYDANGQVLEFSGGANSDVINTFTADGLAATVKRDAITTHILRDAFDQVVRQDVTEGESTGSYFTIPSNSGGDRAVYYRGTSGSPSIKEWTIEGGGRLGVDRTVNSTQDGDVYHRPLNSTLYEMTDQVGSVRAIVSDVVEADANNAGLFLAQVLSASDYEPFGSRRMMRHSDVTDGSYRYGWQGMRLFDGHEKRFDYLTQFRLFDTRMGRWQSSDPVFNPGVSPYEGMGSNPLGLTDPLGLWVRAIGGDAEAAIKSSVGDFSAFVQFEGGILQIAPLREGVAKAMAEARAKARKEGRIFTKADRHKVMDSNIAVLARLAENPYSIEVEVAPVFSVRKAGELQSWEFDNGRNALTAAERGNWHQGLRAITLLDRPDRSAEAVSNTPSILSTNELIRVVINPEAENLMKGNKNFRTFGQIAAHELFAHVRYYLMMRFGVDESIWYHLFINQNDGKGGTVEVDVSPIKNVRNATVS